MFFDLTRNRNHTLYIEGLLNNGGEVSRSRSFYTGEDVYVILCTRCSLHIIILLCYTFADDSDHCLAHVINEVTVDGGNVTIEWEATGNGAGIVPILCKLRGLTFFSPCESNCHPVR